MKAALATLLTLTGPAQAVSSAVQSIVISHVAVVSMSDDRVSPDQTVLIQDGKIVSIGKSVQVPAGSIAVDGGGRFLMPSLADMHVHLFIYVPGTGFGTPSQLEAPVAGPEASCTIRNELALLLYHGVTYVRNMSGNRTVLQWADRVEHGEAIGPHIVSASPIIDGDPPSDPKSGALRISNAAEVASDVARIAAVREGDQRYRYLKVYNMLKADVYREIVVQGKKYHLPIVGHVPFAVGLEGALSAGQLTIEHLRGYDVDPLAPPTTSLSVARFLRWNIVSDARMTALAKESKESGVWNVPTLTINFDTNEAASVLAGADGMATALSRPLYRHLTEPQGQVFPKEISDAIASTRVAQYHMVKHLSDAGARILAGTDEPLSGLVPGYSLVREIELLHDAGLTPYQALRSATRAPHEMLGHTDMGTLEVGKRAELILVDENPLEHLSTLHAVRGVLTSGKWWTSEALKALMIRTNGSTKGECAGSKG
jgi:imidazolonepropionase-like amidohydrolase